MGTKFFYRDIDLIYFVNNKLINSCTNTAHTLNTPFNAYPKGQLVKDLINQKDRVLLSFSGGQDSICFVFILNQLYCQLELDITFFWCHHLWQTDSFYLMQQIVKLSFLFQFNSCFPIPLSCISSELLARKWRQSCSYRVSLFYNYSKICLAHTFNDKVENIFLNFIRGTGLIGLAPLRWIQLAKRICKPNIILNNFVNTAYSFFCISPYKSSDKSPSLNPLQVAQLTPKGLRLGDLSEDLYGNEFRRNNEVIVLYKSKICKNCVNEMCGLATCKGYSYSNSSEVWKRNGSLPQRGMPTHFVNTTLLRRGTRRTLLFIPSNAYPKGQLAKEMCIPSTQGNFDKLKNLTKEVIRKIIQKGYQTPLKKGKLSLNLAHKKSKIANFIKEELAHRQKNNEVFNPLQVAQLTPKGLRLGDLSEDLYRVSISLRNSEGVSIPHTNLRFVPSMRVGVHFSGATCKKYAYSFGVTEENVMYGLNKPLNKAWGKELLDGCYIVRPLLSISRIELNKICYFWELPIYPDKSNQKVKFLRNRVRGQLLPAIKLFFNLNIENIFLQLAKIVETEDYCLTQIVNEFTKNTDMYHTKLDIYSKRKK